MRKASRFLLLPAKIKSIDFERFIYLYAVVASRMKNRHVLFETQVSEKNRRFSTVLDTFFGGQQKITRYHVSMPMVRK